MLTRWRGWTAAASATVITVGLVIADLTDNDVRLWWDRHALTSDTVSGLLVLLITVLVVDQVVRLRQLNDRSQAVAAQTAIMMAQASRSTKAISAAIGEPGDRDNALDEVRTYLLMLLVGAPVLIDDKVARNFLEQAQNLGGELARALAVTAAGKGGYKSSLLDEAFTRLQAASVPLLKPLSHDERVAAAGIATD
jgi:uncharacterized membrane protein YcjF (UPF0283 family)